MANPFRTLLASPMPPRRGRRDGRSPRPPLLFPVTALLFLSLLTAAGVWGAPPGPVESQGGLLPGQETVLDRCLRVSVLSINDRDGVLDHFDWITLRVFNGCKGVRRHLLMEVVLVDPLGRRHGSRIWVLRRGEFLRPGSARTEHFAIPDPDNRLPQKWMVRMLYVEAQRTARVPAGPVKSSPGRMGRR